jgi:hypothetical protein
VSASTDVMRLRTCTSTLRSRNAGSFFITIDAVFRTNELYTAWRESGLLSPDPVAKIFGVAATDIDVIWFPPAMAVKLTLPRRQTAGGPNDHDTDGAQLFVLLLELAIPAAVVG